MAMSREASKSRICALARRWRRSSADFAASLEDFLKVWRSERLEHLRVAARAAAAHRDMINGTPSQNRHTAKLADRVPASIPRFMFQRSGRKGHLALEVHDNGPMGRNRWERARCAAGATFKSLSYENPSSPPPCAATRSARRRADFTRDIARCFQTAVSNATVSPR